MQNAYQNRLYLLTFSQLDKTNRKLTLCSNLVNWIHNHNGGWSTQSYANTQGK